MGETEAETSREFGKLAPPYPVKRCAASDCAGDTSLDAGAYLLTDMDSGKLVTLCTACTEDVELHNGLRFRRVML